MPFTIWRIVLAYRKFAQTSAPSLKGRKEDCADLSIMVLINFAQSNALPLSFYDVDDWLYASKANSPIGPFRKFGLPWFTKENYTRIVQQNIQTKSLYQRNTVINVAGPQIGDLMMRYTTFLGITRKHHTALVFAVYPPGKPHPRENDKSLPSFPGDDAAMAQFNVIEYFKGTVDSDGKTAHRRPDKDIHFDYLNSRGDDKRNSELIYYVNAAQLRDDGFEFRQYSPDVLDNWSDWDGAGLPPRGDYDWDPSSDAGAGSGSRTG
jgi:hypothetical protein